MNNSSATRTINRFFNVKSQNEQAIWDKIKDVVIKAMWKPLSEIRSEIDKNLTELGSEQLGLAWAIIEGPILHSGSDKISLRIGISLNVYDENAREDFNTEKLLWCEIYYDKQGYYTNHCVIEEAIDEYY